MLRTASLRLSSFSVEDGEGGMRRAPSATLLPMRIGIVSDVHCNADGLRLAIEHMGPIDELLCAGDIVYQYRFGNEVIEVLRRIQRPQRPWKPRPHAAEQGRRTCPRRRHRASGKPRLPCPQQPIAIEVKVGGKKLVMTHGSPIEPYDRYVYPGSKEFAELADYAADYLILGHTHYQMAERLGRCLVINPGSAGEGSGPPQRTPPDLLRLGRRVRRSNVYGLRRPPLRKYPSVRPFQELSRRATHSQSEALSSPLRSVERAGGEVTARFA